MKTWAMLIRRELWEHRGLWMGPPIAALFVTVIALFGHVRWQSNGRNINLGGDWSAASGAMYAMAFGVSTLLLIVTSIMVFGYLLECLYSERKDRSILFWRSLPVTDRDTVLSKFVVGMIVAPLISFVLVAISHAIITAYLLLGPTQGNSTFTSSWGWDDWARVTGGLFLRMWLLLLWYAPLAAWLMLASAFARRSPFLYVALPLFAVLAVESVVFGTRVVRDYLQQRLMFPHGLDGTVLQEPQLWIGVAAAAVFLGIAIRLRRYRDDA